jgi:hypothetical protein
MNDVQFKTSYLNFIQISCDKLSWTWLVFLVHLQGRASDKSHPSGI